MVKKTYVLVIVFIVALRKVQVMQGSPALPASGCNRSKKKFRTTRKTLKKKRGERMQKCLKRNLALQGLWG